MNRRVRIAGLLTAVALCVGGFYACARKAAKVKLPPQTIDKSEADAERADRAAEAALSDAKRAGEAAQRAEGVSAQGEASFAKRLRSSDEMNRAYAPPLPSQTKQMRLEAGVGGARDEESPAALPPSFAGEELWVIARAEPQAAPAGATMPDRPDLRAKLPSSEKEVPLPLKHTDVRASVAGYIASVRVQQQYHNPYAEKIEAIYVFPLPENAAVSEFVMTIGERHIRGIIREREEAERVYAEAKRQGYTASLLTQERPNIFTQSVANIEPGKEIDIDLTYFNTLAYHDGEYEFVFPMVVGPRFNPAGSTTGIGAVPRGQKGISGQPVEVQYLRPGPERSGHDIALTVDVDAGVSIESITSPSHAVEITRLSPSRGRVALSRLDTIPNKDFVLRYKVAGKTVKTAFLAHRDPRGGFFTMMLQPPAQLANLPRAPMEMVFVLDCSGSMSGYPIAKAKGALIRALKRLGPDDTFQVIRFSDNSSQFGSTPVSATPRNVERAVDYVNRLEGEGGTMMIEGIKAALDFPHDPRRLRIVSFMTDGYIGNEAEILGEIQQRLGASRIFSFGVGSSVNRYLLDSMAYVGKGAVAYVGLDEGSERAVDTFYERISHPALTDIRVDWGKLEVSDVYPRRIPDLFVGRPVIVTGRFQGRGKTAVRISGRVGGEDQTLTLQVDPDAADAQNPALASIWARTKIADLDVQATHADARELGEQIKTVALEYGLMSAYTAFVAVDSIARTAGDHGTTVVQPVPMPEGVPYDTTVQTPPR